MVTPLIPMTPDQTESMDRLLEKINMADYLPQFQMLINGEVSPADIAHLLVCFYTTGFNAGIARATEYEHKKLLAVTNAVRNFKGGNS